MPNYFIALIFYTILGGKYPSLVKCFHPYLTSLAYSLKLNSSSFYDNFYVPTCDYLDI